MSEWVCPKCGQPGAPSAKTKEPMCTRCANGQRTVTHEWPLSNERRMRERIANLEAENDALAATFREALERLEAKNDELRATYAELAEEREPVGVGRGNE